MNYFNKLPFLLSAFMSVLVGVISFSSGTDNNIVYVQMMVTMVVFYMIGLYAKKTLTNIKTEVEEKKVERDKEELANAAKNEGQQTENEVQESESGQNINLAAGQQDDGFEPLTVSRVIASKLDNN